MKQKIVEFANFIKEKTGLDISVMNKNGDSLVGAKFSFANLKGEVYLDKKGNRTLFKFGVKGVTYIGKIDGAMESEKTLALLIKELAKNYFDREIETFDQTVKSIIIGEKSYSETQNFLKKINATDSECFIMLLNATEEKIGDIYDVLKNYESDTLEFLVKMDKTQLALVKFYDKGKSDYRSPSEYAEVLRMSLYEETGANVFIAVGGLTNSFAYVKDSYEQALSVIRMSGVMEGKDRVHSFKEYVLINILEDLPKNKLSEYLKILSDEGVKEILEDEELVKTAEAFLSCNLNSSETARKLYLHRNTLTYRLDKIEKYTGLNIRKFSDAITFRIISVLKKIV